MGGLLVQGKRNLEYVAHFVQNFVSDWLLQWSYAFSIVPLTANTPTLPTPANATLNPFLPNQVPARLSPQLPKRSLGDDGPQFRWSTEGHRDTKRRKRGRIFLTPCLHNSPERIDNGWEGRNRGAQNTACQTCGSAEVHFVQYVNPHRLTIP